MERIASFTVNHNTLVPGLYLSRRDGDIVTLDCGSKSPTPETCSPTASFTPRSISSPPSCATLRTRRP